MCKELALGFLWTVVVFLHLSDDVSLSTRVFISFKNRKVSRLLAFHIPEVILPKFKTLYIHTSRSKPKLSTLLREDEEKIMQLEPRFLHK